MKSRILIFLILVSCSINQIKAPSGRSSFRESNSSHSFQSRPESFNGSRESDVVRLESFSGSKKNIDNPHIAERAALLSPGQRSSEKDSLDQSKTRSKELSSENFQEKSNFLGIDFAGLFSRESRSVEEKSNLDRKLDDFENRILNEYRNKNKSVSGPLNQEQADSYVKRSFQDVYKECKNLVDGDISNPPLNSFAKFVKSFNRSVSITTQLYGLKSQKFVGKAVDGIKAVAERFNSLSKEDQEAVYNQMMTTKQSQTDLIANLEKQLSLKDKELYDLRQRLNKVEVDRSWDLKSRLAEIDSLTGAAKSKQRSLQDQIDRLTFENQQISEKLLSQDSGLSVKSEQSLIMPSEQKRPDILQEQKRSEVLEKTDVSQIELQKELQALKAQNALLLEQLEYSRQLGQGKFSGEVKVSSSDKSAMKLEDGIQTQEIKNEAGQVVSKKLFTVDEDTGLSVPFQEVVLGSSSFQPDGSIKVINDVYSLDSHGKRFNFQPNKEVEVFVFDRDGNKRVKSKELQDFSGKILNKTEYIPDDSFDLGRLYDVSLIGLRRDANFSIISYERTLSKGIETVLVRAAVKGSLFEVKAVQSEKTVNGIVNIINKIEMQKLDANGKVHGSPQVITETVKLDKNQDVMSKMVQVAGKTQAVEYVYDRSHKNSDQIKEEIVYEVKGKKNFTEVSRISKEYWQDQDGNEMVTDKDRNGVIAKITKNGQEVAGSQGIYFDAILNKDHLMSQLEQGVYGKLSDFQLGPKVDAVVEVYKKEIRDNIARELNLSIDSVKQSAPTFGDLRAQKHIDDTVDKVYKSYEKQIDLFIAPIKNSFIENFKLSQPVVLESNGSRAKPLIKINSSKKIAKDNAVKLAQEKKESQIRQQKTIEITEKVDSYTPEQKEDLLYSYFAEQGIVNSQSLSPQLKSEYLKLAENKKITELVNEAMQSLEVKKLIKSAGDQASVRSGFALTSDDLTSQVKDSPSNVSLSSKLPVSFLDMIKAKKENNPKSAGVYGDGPAKNSSMMAELQAKLALKNPVV